MLDKAANSFASAKILQSIGNDHYCMAAQCAYYSGLQNAMALLMVRHNFSAEQLYDWYQEQKNKSEHARQNSHGFYIMMFERAITSLTDNKRTARELKQLLLDLKIEREKAAYRSPSIDEQQMEKIIIKAHTLSERVPGYMTMERNKRKII